MLNIHDANENSSNILENSKHVLDLISIGTVAGTLIGFLPSMAAILTIIWTIIRIYETKTVQKILGKIKPIKPIPIKPIEVDLN